MQFGTTYAPTDFQGYISNTFRKALDEFASAYLKDIPVYCNLEEEYQEHVQWIMHCVWNARLYLNLKKCEFEKKTFQYFRLIKSTNGISIDMDMIKMVRHCSRER
jgi:hypothetical protein